MQFMIEGNRKAWIKLQQSSHWPRVERKRNDGRAASRRPGRVTKSRLHVEYISDDMDDDLGICSEDLNDDMDTGVVS